MKKLLIPIALVGTIASADCAKPDCFDEATKLFRYSIGMRVCQAESSKLFDALELGSPLKDREALYNMRSCILRVKAAQNADRSVDRLVERLKAKIGKGT